MATWRLGRTEIPITTKNRANTLGVSLEGCPYRGTLVCLTCYYSPPVECDYRCIQKHRKGQPVGLPCEHRFECRCGHDQTERLRAWGLVG